MQIQIERIYLRSKLIGATAKRGVGKLSTSQPFYVTPIATLDDPEAFPPAVLIQMADAPAWVATLHELPKFDRFPG